MRVVMCCIMTCLLFPDTGSTTANKDTSKPFAKLEAHVNENWGGWAGAKRDFVPLFIAERRRLGEAFQKELINYVGDDANRHYWCACFLVKEQYLQGNKEMPELALLLLHQAVVLAKKAPSKKEEDLLPTLVKTHILAGIVSKELGLSYQAESHKKIAEDMTAKHPDLAGAWPALSDKEWKLWDAVGKAKTSK